MARAADSSATGGDMQRGAPAVLRVTPPSLGIDRPSDMGELEDHHHVRHLNAPSLRPTGTTRG
jgi:hypothetical protein